MLVRPNLLRRERTSSATWYSLSTRSSKNSTWSSSCRSSISSRWTSDCGAARLVVQVAQQLDQAVVFVAAAFPARSAPLRPLSAPLPWCRTAPSTCSICTAISFSKRRLVRLRIGRSAPTRCAASQRLLVLALFSRSVALDLFDLLRQPAMPDPQFRQLRRPRRQAPAARFAAPSCASASARCSAASSVVDLVRARRRRRLQLVQTPPFCLAAAPVSSSTCCADLPRLSNSVVIPRDDDAQSRSTSRATRLARLSISFNCAPSSCNSPVSASASARQPRRARASPSRHLFEFRESRRCGPAGHGSRSALAARDRARRRHDLPVQRHQPREYGSRARSGSRRRASRRSPCCTAGTRPPCWISALERHAVDRPADDALLAQSPRRSRRSGPAGSCPAAGTSRGPPGVCFRKPMADFAASACSTTTLLMLPPSAASMARSYVFSVDSRSPTGPITPRTSGS